MTTPTIETSLPDPVSREPTAPMARRRDLEPSLLSLIVAALVLLVAVGVVLWTASSVPFGRSVIVTIRNP